MKKAVVFDVDGTLWDAVDNIACSWNQSLKKLGISDVEITRDNIVGLMGKTMDKFAEALLPQYPPEEGNRIMDILEQEENEYLKKVGAALFGDVRATFQKLREMGYFIGIVSNSQSGYIEAFVEHNHLEDLVDGIGCYGDTMMGKADNLKLLIRQHGLEKCWYLGDTDGDYFACREAGVPFIWAAYGFGSVNADVPRIDSLEELTDAIGALDAESA